MPKWVPWVALFAVVFGVVGFFVYRKVQSDIKSDLADAKQAAGDAKTATDVVTKVGDLWSQVKNVWG